ncbi:UNVERIFIED_ORG: hypothetical protein GGI57_000803 [Rhizobium aethiopicum]
MRGLHAWLGYFSPKVRERCIAADPYGFLRYGDTANLNAQSARHLLRALTKLADEDPYFRSEDWGVQSVAGLARLELKPEISKLITSPQRHVQLSALLLTSLIGSSLTNDIVPELLALIRDIEAPYVERSEAAEALAKSDVVINWEQLIGELLAQKRHESNRLAAETIAVVGPSRFSPDILGRTLTALNGINESARGEARVTGSDFLIIKRIEPELSKAVLDVISSAIASKKTGRHWHPGRTLTSAILRLLSSAINGPPIDPARFWSWVSNIESQGALSGEALEHIKAFFKGHDAFRRDVQRLALYDPTIDGGPWMAIVHELPRALPGLHLTTEDCAFFLNEIADTAVLDDHQRTLWGDLVRVTGHPTRYDEMMRAAIDKSIEKHSELAVLYEEITRPPTRDYEAEEQKRQEAYEIKRQAGFRKHRAQFLKDLAEIARGEHIGALVSLANAYLNRYSDLDQSADPIGRLVEWVGEEIANAAILGFVAILHRENLPDLEKIWSIRGDGKQWTIEPAMLAGISEIIRTGRSLTEIPDRVVDAVLGIWWDMPEFHSSKLGADIERALENFVFRELARAEKFVTTVIESQFISGKPHISGLYRFLRDQRFLQFSSRLAVKWLRAYPQASYNSQLELLQFLLHRDNQVELTALVRERMSGLHLLNAECQQLWTGLAFCIASDAIPAANGGNRPSKELIWPIKTLLLPDRSDGRNFTLAIDRYEAIVEFFAPLWPSVGHPVGGWSGDQNPWDASEFISHCIDALGLDRTATGTEALEHLASSISDISYSHRAMHVLHTQRRMRRDEEYTPPTFDAVAKILTNAEPSSVRDLQVVILDHLHDLQQYVTNADTGGWEAFWQGDQPKIENTCRDRLLDLLRPRLTGAVELFPELPMPDHNRVDIYATILGEGLPIEIKGQWHSEVWNASKTQLDEKYARDWRTSGRGIYLVLWFGQVGGKKLRRRPDGEPLPKSPAEFQALLSESLGEGERSRIDVVVFDVSKRPRSS